MHELKRTTRFNRTKSEDISNMLYGKIPPQARELEEVILGALLIENDAINEVGGFLTPAVFYVDAHATIYESIVQLFLDNSPIDILTVTERLRKNGKLEEVGGVYYISELTSKVASSANIEYHARILFQKWMQREIITVSNELIRESYDDTTDVFDLLSKAELVLSNITDSLKDASVKTMAELAKNTITEMQSRSDRPIDELLGVTTSSKQLDTLTDGWQEPDFIIFAGGTGEGKSTYMLQNAEEISRSGTPVAVFTLEMSAKQLVWKVFSSEIGATIMEIKKGQLSAEQWEKLDNLYKRVLENDNLYIIDKGGLDIVDIVSISRGLVKKKGVKIIFIDYLQLITTGKGGKNFGLREQEVAHISRRLKGLAKELGIPVVALSQLSRMEKGGRKRAYVLSDLRESGSLEQDADVVMFIFRPSYHGIVNNFEENEPPYKNSDVLFILAKYRLGETGKTLRRFNGSHSRFEDISDYNPMEDNKQFLAKDEETFKKIFEPSCGNGVSLNFDTDDDLPF